MKTPPLLTVPFREVRHDEPDEGLHYESVAVRGIEMNWTIPAHRHEGLHQFQCLARGRVRGTVDGRDFEAHAPALLMMAPRSVHGFTYTRRASGHQVTVPSPTLQRLLTGSTLLDGQLAQSFVLSEETAAAREVAPLFAQLAAEFAGASPGRVHALMATATLIAVAFARAQGAAAARERGTAFAREPTAGSRDTLAQRFVALVEQHYAEHRPLVFYAQRLGVTPDHLSRSCRRAMHKSALALAQERVILEARRLMAYSAMPVGKVADALGFADPAYFNRVFVRAVGHPPMAYRRLVAQGVRAGSA